MLAPGVARSQLNEALEGWPIRHVCAVCSRSPWPAAYDREHLRLVQIAESDAASCGLLAVILCAVTGYRYSATVPPGRLDPPLTVVLEGQARAEMAARPGH